MLSVLSCTLSAYIPPREQYELERAILDGNHDKVAQGLKDLDRPGVSSQEKKNLYAFLLELSDARIKKGNFPWQTDETMSLARLVLGGLVGAGAIMWAVSPSGFERQQLKTQCDCCIRKGGFPEEPSRLVPYGPSMLGRFVSLGVSLAAFYQAYQGHHNLDTAEKESIKPAMAIHELLKASLVALEQ